MNAQALNRRGNRPGLEARPRLLHLADPKNLESPVEAIKAAGTDRAKIREWLEKNTYRGLAGQYKFDEEHNGAYFAIIIQYHMKDGKAVPEVKKKYDFTP